MKRPAHLRHLFVRMLPAVFILVSLSLGTTGAGAMSHFTSLSMLSQNSARDSRSMSLPTSTRILTGDVPSVVADKTATPLAELGPSSNLTLLLTLRVRNPSLLDAAIAAASDPFSPSYRRYLTSAEYDTTFAPTMAEVQAVGLWAHDAGLTMGSIAPHNLAVEVSGTTQQVERTLSVSINRYRTAERGVFEANDRAPRIPADLPISGILGLSTYDWVVDAPSTSDTGTAAAHASITTRPNLTSVDPSQDLAVCPYLQHDAGTPPRSCYKPSDIAAAYNFGPVGDATGETIAFIGPGYRPIPQSVLHTFADATSTPEMRLNASGPDGLQYFQVDDQFHPVPQTTPVEDGNGENAVSVEWSHGLAPHSHVNVWSYGGYEIEAYRAVVSAVSDPATDVLGWIADFEGVPPTQRSGGAADLNLPNTFNPVLQLAAALGKTFFAGARSWCASCGSLNPEPPYFPYVSPYVVAVGQTTLQTTADGRRSAELGYPLSGGTCAAGATADDYPRPYWQKEYGVVATTYTGDQCLGRAIPDVTAVGDQCSGINVYNTAKAGASPREWIAYGHASGATPLWVGMGAALDRYLKRYGSALGFATPHIYQLAEDRSGGGTYERDFHDIT